MRLPAEAFLYLPSHAFFLSIIEKFIIRILIPPLSIYQQAENVFYHNKIVKSGEADGELFFAEKFLGCSVLTSLAMDCPTVTLLVVSQVYLQDFQYQYYMEIIVKLVAKMLRYQQTSDAM